MHGMERVGVLQFSLTISAHLMLSFGDASVDALVYMRKQEIESLFLIFAAGFGSIG